MKYFRTLATSEWVKMVMTKGRESPAHDVIEGLPEDAELHTVQYDPMNNSIVFYWRSETVGNDVPEGSLIHDVPIIDVVCKRREA